MAYNSLQQVQFGLAKESVRGTAEAAPTKWYPIEQPDIKFGPSLIADKALRGIRAEMPPRIGRKHGTGKIKFIADAQVMGEFMLSALGAVTSTEVGVVTIISGTNNKLDFNIGASQLTASVAAGTYQIGTSQATASSLCKAIFDAIVAAEAVGTYTVTYSRTTKKFTITRSAGTLNLLWNTGTNTAISIASIMGFSTAANSTGAITYTGGSTVNYAFSHAFSLGTSIYPQTYSFFIYNGLATKVYNGVVVKSIMFNGPVDNEIAVEVDFLFLDEQNGSMGSVAFPTARYLSFENITYKIAGSTVTDVRSWTLKIDNQAKILQTLTGSLLAQDIVAPDKVEVTGTMHIFFANETERAKFIANTAVALRMLIAGDVIAGSATWGIDLPIAEAHYSDYPFGYEENLLAANVNFKAHYDGSSLILPVLTNVDVSY